MLNDIVPEKTQKRSGKGLDWSKLPWGLGHIASDAEEFGVFSSPQSRAELVEELRSEHEAGGKKSSRYQRLSLFAMMFPPSDRRQVQKWFERFPPEEHKEASLVFSLILLLDEHFADKLELADALDDGEEDEDEDPDDEA